MPSEMNEFFTAAKALTPKVACVENYLMGLRVLQMYLILNIRKIYLADDYPKFLKQQNIVFACIGKHDSDKRHNFEMKMMLNENKKKLLMLIIIY